MKGLIKKFLPQNKICIHPCLVRTIKQKQDHLIIINNSSFSLQFLILAAIFIAMPFSLLPSILSLFSQTAIINMAFHSRLVDFLLLGCRFLHRTVQHHSLSKKQQHEHAYQSVSLLYKRYDGCAVTVHSEVHGK